MINLEKEYERVQFLLKKQKCDIRDYNYGEKIEFSCNGIDGLVGNIEIKDYSGGGIYYGISPTVDIMCSDGIFYKHISIVDIKKYV